MLTEHIIREDRGGWPVKVDIRDDIIYISTENKEGSRHIGLSPMVARKVAQIISSNVLVSSK